MARVADQDVSRWIREHQRDMILCPNQPGLLLITKKACLKRYRAALARVFETVSEEDTFHYALKKGLSLCEGCPIGRRLVEEERGSVGATEQPVSREAVNEG